MHLLQVAPRKGWLIVSLGDTVALTQLGRQYATLGHEFQRASPPSHNGPSAAVAPGFCDAILVIFVSGGCGDEHGSSGGPSRGRFSDLGTFVAASSSVILAHVRRRATECLAVRPASVGATNI